MFGAVSSKKRHLPTAPFFSCIFFCKDHSIPYCFIDPVASFIKHSSAKDDLFLQASGIFEKASDSFLCLPAYQESHPSYFSPDFLLHVLLVILLKPQFCFIAMKLINKSAILFPEIFIQPACIKHLFCDIRLLFPQATIICIEIYITILQQLSDDLLSVFPSFLFDTFLHALWQSAEYLFPQRLRRCLNPLRYDPDILLPWRSV